MNTHVQRIKLPLVVAAVFVLAISFVFVLAASGKQADEMLPIYPMYAGKLDTSKDAGLVYDPNTLAVYRKEDGKLVPYTMLGEQQYFLVDEYRFTSEPPFAAVQSEDGR